MNARRILVRTVVAVVVAAAIGTFLRFQGPAASCELAGDPQRDGCYIPGID